jgi:hypothetical protein
VDIVVVAVNQPPVLYTPVDITGVEDTMVDVTGIRVTDPDVAEVITSRLAHLVRRTALSPTPLGLHLALSCVWYRNLDDMQGTDHFERKFERMLLKLSSIFL